MTAIAGTEPPTVPVKAQAERKGNSAGRQMPNIWHLISGINVPPAVTGAVRAILWSAAVAAIEKGIQVLTSTTLPPSWALWAPIIVMVLRLVEGLLDQSSQSKTAKG